MVACLIDPFSSPSSSLSKTLTKPSFSISSSLLNHSTSLFSLTKPKDISSPSSNNRLVLHMCWDGALSSVNLLRLQRIHGKKENEKMFLFFLFPFFRQSHETVICRNLWVCTGCDISQCVNFYEKKMVLHEVKPAWVLEKYLRLVLVLFCFNYFELIYSPVNFLNYILKKLENLLKSLTLFSNELIFLKDICNTAYTKRKKKKGKKNNKSSVELL